VENSINGNAKMEDIFYAALALHVAKKPLNKENIRIVLKAAGTPVDEAALDILGAFIESLKDSLDTKETSGDGKLIKLLTSVVSKSVGPAEKLAMIRSATTPLNTGRYIYGIVAGAAETRLGPIGINGSEVYTINNQDLSALVHACPAKPYQSTDDETVKTWVKTHQSVLDAAKKQFQVIIPLSFDTILKPVDDHTSPDQVVRNWLEKDRTTFQAMIKQFEGKDEYAVQISYTPSLAGQYMPEASQESLRINSEMMKKSPGIAYLYKHKLENTLRADMEKLADSWFKDFMDRISGQANAVILEKNRKTDDGKVMLLNLSCLVTRENVDRLGIELEKINNMEGFSVHFSGPWPPYSFVVKLIVADDKNESNEPH
jgi:hypothetical protein